MLLPLESKIAGQLTRICFHREHILLLRRDRLWFLQSASSIGGRISETTGEKRNRGINTQKSNATVQDLMRISIAASSAINGGMKKLLGGRGGKTSLGGCGGLTGTCTSLHVGAYIKMCH
ncbi:BnaA04g11500D [Brassica napus]|uniref:BnaA04g11500D protein n=1 Tax=Brassica napus TaxID=3708 RepID=A0A078FS65_BRANA|nr:BnaA04g11500D [Brassica napus]